MTTGYETITLGGEELELRNLSRTKVLGTIKQKVGGTIVKHRIPAREQQDWQITANGIIVGKAGTTALEQREALEALNNNSQYHYSDGLILASMIVESLSFNDTGDNPLHYEYSISMIEYNQ